MILEEVPKSYSCNTAVDKKLTSPNVLSGLRPGWLLSSIDGAGQNFVRTGYKSVCRSF
jgi:hypothetical protein